MRTMLIERARRLRTLVWLLTALTVMAFGPTDFKANNRDQGDAVTDTASAAPTSSAQELAVAQTILAYVSRTSHWGVAVDTPRLRPRVFAFSLQRADSPDDPVQLHLWLYEQGNRLCLELQFTPDHATLPQLEGKVAANTFAVRLPGLALIGSPQTQAVGRDGLIRFRLQAHPDGSGSARLVLETTPAGRVEWPAEGASTWKASFWRDVKAGQKPPASVPYQVRKVQTGMASWYGRGFAGRRTASGEPFDPSAPTAAHRNLPIGTQVRVTNLQNGRSAVVRINDRGPYSGRRIIDVSRGVAERLGFRNQGVARVRLEVLQRRKEAGR